MTAVLASIAEAEQYFSIDRLMARWTLSCDSAWPVTMKCMWMRVKTFGSVSARSASSSTTQSSIASRPFSRM
ncbi:hypothetical protein X773_18405 [Mesorhizobium sp. LSJC285A00]|nr:hypothetical protein X773_18405 [Mesorhizobium sp. LSJC285A00]